MDKNNEFIPSFKYDWLTSLYDPLIRLVLPESSFKNRLVNQAMINSGERVLDIGCGTATLTLLVKRKHPHATVMGLDADTKVLEIAKTKSVTSNLDIIFDHAMAFELPYSDNSFDHVFSSMLFYHLSHKNKILTIIEVLRVLRPGGWFHVAEWGKPQNLLSRISFLVIQIFDGFENTSDNINGLLPQMFSNSGFEEVRETATYETTFGTISMHKARKAV
ncbi:MAG: class I SAM-dependent methyltransferase [Nitrososphaeraceae archaeon]